MRPSKSRWTGKASSQRSIAESHPTPGGRSAQQDHAQNRVAFNSLNHLNLRLDDPGDANCHDEGADSVIQIHALKFTRTFLATHVAFKFRVNLPLQLGAFTTVHGYGRPKHAREVPTCCRVFEQRAWAAQQVASQPDSQFWRLVGLLEQQFMGLVDGYQVSRL